MTETNALSQPAPVTPAFPEPVFDAARSFRAILTALSRPGTVVTVEADLEPPAPMGRAMAATLLTLCDVDTAVHLDATLDEGVRTWSDFHTAAPRLAARDANKAQFVFATTPAGRLPLAELSQGTQAYPDRSVTCVWACERLTEGSGSRLTGPGIEAHALLDCDVFDDAFRDTWAANGARFPRGVDLLLTCGDRLAALPRTTRIGGLV
ncbi:MAG: phosphonate C-P lyase system protein PhnH [Pseudomonadota bacterium]